ncbi:MAG: hypothetical protein U0R76_08565 [Candidatus Nanopelagicales bacterium]
MALTTHPAALPHGLPHLPEVTTAVRRWVVPIASMVLCAGGLAVLVPPALRAAEPPTTGQVSVQVLGTLSTEGLPQHAAVSLLTVRNDGPEPLVWSARTEVSGAGAGAVEVETWLPGPSGCGEPTHVLTPADWSRTPLAPGSATTLCARVRATGQVAGSATPSVTVAARPA